MYKQISFFLLAVLAIACAPQNKEVGLTALKVSDNQRYFTDSTAQPVFWLGDTGWLLLTRLSREETVKYLDARAQQGYNVLQVMVLHDLNACNFYGDSALIGKSVAKPLVTEGNNPADSLQYDYWDHVDFVVAEAQKRHLYMALVPVWGNNVKNGHVSREEMTVYGKFIAERYKNSANIVWLNGGDVRGADSIDTWNILGNMLHQHDPNHLATYHPRGRNSSSRWFQNEKWLDFNMSQSGHRTYEQDNDTLGMMFGEDNWRFIQMDLALTPLKPTLDGEPSYEEIPHGLHDTLAPRWTDSDLRRYAYWSVFAGAAGFTYGHNSVMQFHSNKFKEGAYGAKSYWTDAINAPGALQMQHLKKLMLAHSYFDRVPDQSLVVASSQGEKYDYVVATRGNDYALFYSYNGKDFSVDLAKVSATVSASWYDPRTGLSSEIGDFETNEPIAFNPPGEPKNGNDWVLVVVKK